MSVRVISRSIPDIDVSGLLSSDPLEVFRISNEVGKVAEKYSFFYAYGDIIDEEYFHCTVKVSKMFFSLSLTEKMRSYIGISNEHVGYVPKGEEHGDEDFKEALDFPLEFSYGKSRDFPFNNLSRSSLCPSISGFFDFINFYFNSMVETGNLLLCAFARYLDIPINTFIKYIGKAPCQARLLHYPYDPSIIGCSGIKEHTDLECITLIQQTEPGLEVMSNFDDWISIMPMPGATFVTIGDTLEFWTNGTFRATIHRVREVAAERFSFPIFFNVTHDTEIRPLLKFMPTDIFGSPALKVGDYFHCKSIQKFAYLREN